MNKHWKNLMITKHNRNKGNTVATKAHNDPKALRKSEDLAGYNFCSRTTFNNPYQGFSGGWFRW